MKNVLLWTPPRWLDRLAPNFAWSICVPSWQEVIKRILIDQKTPKIWNNKFLHCSKQTVFCIFTKYSPICVKFGANQPISSALVAGWQLRLVFSAMPTEPPSSKPAHQAFAGKLPSLSFFGSNWPWFHISRLGATFPFDQLIGVCKSTLSLATPLGPICVRRPNHRLLPPKNTAPRITGTLKPLHCIKLIYVMFQMTVRWGVTWKVLSIDSTDNYYQPCCSREGFFFASFSSLFWF